ncbi:MAG TPA: carbamoyl-phosphate synthase (glutamine-hydrolyzing) large subunit [Candidatus Polarisedimenticolia bacterium]|nr:carbamoyl-phosphate synthase (glutamine-hydrolyzing) large subunit [Candidatus Polarisedimenticolia bacterium]
MTRKAGRRQRVLLLGSGALKIGEAGEFDYSGSQAIKALKEEGVEVWLINPNIATIQTSPGLADRIFLLPVEPGFVTRVIAEHRPDGLLLSFGGQTALNCGLALHRRGVLKRYGVKVYGSPISAIEMTEDRQRFAQELRRIGIQVPRSAAARTLSQALRIARRIGYPVMMRTGFTLGGRGSGIVRGEAELRARATEAFTSSPQILIEEDLTGWKEIEYEIVRDRADNIITVCNMENVDPLGIHTGESIVVAPSQTLTDREYFMLRDLSFQAIRHFGIVGECNIQFALDPRSDAYRVIEVNARLSRSSALASKATGYPLARIAAKLALGRLLPDLKNSMNDTTTACFEPALDYLVVKMPKWDLEKFRGASHFIGSEMKSVGEVMAIGRSFEEALQKGCRMLGDGIVGLVDNDFNIRQSLADLAVPTPRRVFALAEAMRRGKSVAELARQTGIDAWFLAKMARIVRVRAALRGARAGLTDELLREAKEAGFSDAQIARATGRKEEAVAAARRSAGIVPAVKQIDTLAAEWPVRTNYLYTTYQGREDDTSPGAADNRVLILGSGAYRIGSSVEFDWCCVSAAAALRRLGYAPVVVNCNPETVSTDYDMGHTLYFEELTFERLRDIWDKERPRGILLAFGGQIPNNLALACGRAGLPVLGTQPVDIDRAEDRHKFSTLLDRLGVPQPPWAEVTSRREAVRFAARVGYPVLVRPSYVLSGAAMRIAADGSQLTAALRGAAEVSRQHPVVISKFIQGAKELEADAVASGGRLLAVAVTEHVENAGVHSGDATVVFPPQKIYLETVRRIRDITARLARALRITGPFNVQYLAIDNEVMVIECNLRASRSFPFISKVSGVDFVDLATRAMMGEPVQPVPESLLDLDYVGVKAPQFSFSRIRGADPALRVEMASTGEVACLGHDLPEAFLKAILSAGFRLPEKKRVLLSIGSEADKVRFLPSARLLRDLGYTLYATRGTSKFLRHHGIAHTRLYKIRERRAPSLLDFISPERLDLILNVPLGLDRAELTDGYIIRRRAIDYGVPLITNLQLAELLVKALATKTLDDLRPLSYEAYVPGSDPARAEGGAIPAPLRRRATGEPLKRLPARGRRASAPAPPALPLQADLA